MTVKDLSRRPRAARSFENDSPAASRSWVEPFSHIVLILTVCLASGNFSEMIAGPETSNPQQYIVIALWMATIWTSYFRPTILKVESSPGFWLSMAPLVLAVVSIAWSDNPEASIAKSTALALVSFGAYRLIATMPLRSIFDNIIRGLFILNSASMFVSLFVPEIGIEVGWQHAGQWNGIYVSKQTVGITGALLLFLSACRVLEADRRNFHLLAASVALACIAGSESRGGGALAFVSLACIYGARFSARLIRLLAFAPFAMCMIAAALIAYFLITGNKSLLIGNLDIDFTERTLIWQYALSFLPDAPLFGFGLNGFWTLKEVKDVYLEQHGWFLDNYHNGYIGVAMETGGLGFCLFAAGYFSYGMRIVGLIRRLGALQPDMTLTLTFSCMLFFIDFTETFFLRSTNMYAATLTMSILAAFSNPSRASSGSTLTRSRRPESEERPPLSGSARR